MLRSLLCAGVMLALRGEKADSLFAAYIASPGCRRARSWAIELVGFNGFFDVRKRCRVICLEELGVILGVGGMGYVGAGVGVRCRV